MKTINRQVSIAVIAAALISFVTFGEESFPTIAEIDAEIASLANKYGARTLWREFVPTAGRIKELQDKFPTQEVLQVQWHVISNMFSECYLTTALTNDFQLDYHRLADIVFLHLTKYRLFHANTNALMFVADCVSNALPVDASRETAVVEASFRGEQIPAFGSTNALSGTKVVFETYHSSTNYYYQQMLWEKARRMKSGFNYSQSCFRRQVFNCFCELMLHHLSEYPEPVRRSLWDEFCRRAGATDLEKIEASRCLYEDYKITYP